MDFFRRLWGWLSSAPAEPVVVTVTHTGVWQVASRAGVWQVASRTGTWLHPE